MLPSLLVTSLLQIAIFHLHPLLYLARYSRVFSVGVRVTVLYGFLIAELLCNSVAGAMRQHLCSTALFLSGGVLYDARRKSWDAAVHRLRLSREMQVWDGCPDIYRQVYCGYFENYSLSLFHKIFVCNENFCKQSIYKIIRHTRSFFN